MIFFLKKLVSQLFYPLPLALVCVLILLVIAVKQKNRLAQWSLVILLALGGVIAYPVVPQGVAKTLELRYPPFTGSVPRGVPVVVLGGGSRAQSGRPVSTQLSPASLIRLAEGISLWNRSTDSPLILTGGALFDSLTIAGLQRRMAVQLGVDSTKIIVADRALDTEMEAVAVRTLITADTILLVTSALHMPRAVGLFETAGFTVIPAPTQYRAPTGVVTPGDLFPDGENIVTLRKTIHEYIGMLWSSLRGRIE